MVVSSPMLISSSMSASSSGQSTSSKHIGVNQLVGTNSGFSKAKFRDTIKFAAYWLQRGKLIDYNQLVNTAQLNEVD
ncbi:hypothetical protein E5D57_008070 [Metarhizium anisopliae]|nr:hypothetical protein E5D57_008070 [Metarhizium anisopliae]